MTVARTRSPVLAALLLLGQGCGAFLAPSALQVRPSTSAMRSGVSPTSVSTTKTPSMVLTGLPSPKKKKKQQPWDEDFPTTVGKAAFASLKDKARDMMVKGAEKRGLDWTGIVETLQVDCLSVWAPVAPRFSLPSRYGHLAAGLRFRLSYYVITRDFDALTIPRSFVRADFIKILCPNTTLFDFHFSLRFWKFCRLCVVRAAPSPIILCVIRDARGRLYREGNPIRTQCPRTHLRVSSGLP